MPYELSMETNVGITLKKIKRGIEELPCEQDREILCNCTMLLFPEQQVRRPKCHLRQSLMRVKPFPAHCWVVLGLQECRFLCQGLQKWKNILSN